MPILRLRQPQHGARDIAFGTSGLTIGRGVDNDLHLVNPWLSRHHAVIERRGEQYFLADKASRNGTYLNGQAVTEPRVLADGDRIAIGEVDMRFWLGEPRSDLEVAEGAAAFGEGTVILGSEQLSFERFREERSKAPVSDHDLLLTLSAAASALIVHVPMEALVEKVLDLVQQAVPSERAALLLDDDEGSLLVAGRRGFDDARVRISRTLIDTVLEERQGVLTVDARSDQRFDAAQSIMLEGIRSILCVPLWNNHDVIGLIYLDRRFESVAFNRQDLRLVGLMANMAAVKLENARLLAAQLEQERLKQQMTVAAQIQRKLLPARAPKLDGYSVAGDSWSCFEIGGDYFDFIPMQGGRLAIVIADISGKGIGAALLMAVLQASLRALIHAVDGPADLVSRLNTVLIENSPYNKFATLFYAELDPRRNQLVYVNAGHNPGLLCGVSAVRELSSTGPIVGMLEDATFSAQRVRFEPGDTMLLYTDGVTELQSAGGEELGLDRLCGLLSGTGGDLEALLAAVRQLMDGFGGGDPADDATLVAVRRDQR